VANVAGWSFFDSLKWSQTVGRQLKQASNYTAPEFIEAVEKAAAEHPDVWVVFYTLADKYQDVGEYAKAVEACRRCVALRPHDIRSAYAMASIYYVLTAAQWANGEGNGRADAEAMFTSLGLAFDPQACRDALDELHVTVRSAAAAAMGWFGAALMMRPDRESRYDIEASLQLLQERFPGVKPETVSL
jgi:tetratricopeptide (TPR) repeat protein